MIAVIPDGTAAAFMMFLILSFMIPALSFLSHSRANVSRVNGFLFLSDFFFERSPGNRDARQKQGNSQQRPVDRAAAQSGSVVSEH
jgi:hypothetical protein